MRRVATASSIAQEGIWILIIGDFRAIIAASKTGKKRGVWHGEIGRCGYKNQSFVLDWIGCVITQIRGV